MGGASFLNYYGFILITLLYVFFIVQQSNRLLQRTIVKFQISNLSKPPATTTLFTPNAIDWAASMMVFIPEAHTLLTVVQGTDSGRSAKSAVCVNKYRERDKQIQKIANTYGRKRMSDSARKWEERARYCLDFERAPVERAPDRDQQRWHFP